MALEARMLYPREKTLFTVGVVLSAIAWLVLVITIVGLLYALLLGFFVLAAHALFLAWVRNNGVRVDERQLPDLFARIRAAAERIGLRELPEIYVVQGGGVLNAFATKLLSRRYVILLSDLVDHCEDPRQVDFVVGHELAHFAAGHLAWNLFLLPYRLVPWLGAAYSRACEYTCDRAGLAAAGDLEQSLRGLVVLAAGGKMAARVDLQAYAAQRREAGGFWATVLELSSSHPFLSKRVAALNAFARNAHLEPVRRSAAGWLFAPALGGLGGGAAAAGPLVLVAIIGVLAAIAIPNFMKYQLRAKESAVQAGLRALHRAEVQHHEQTGEYREMQVGAAAPTTVAASYTEEQVAGAREIGWEPPAGGYHTYSVNVASTEDGRQALAICAESDLDGDGVFAAWMIWEPIEIDGRLLGPGSPCRFSPRLGRDATFGDDDQPGVPVRVSPEGVY